jgi:myo-inositol-1(or 4)-monophosphatase
MSSATVNAEDLLVIESQITELVRQAGQIALSHFQLPLHVEFKRDNRSDPVTEADREVEEFLKSSITERFPGHAIIGEEGTEVDVERHEFLWALDPVDGTTNFMNGLPLFGCSAGLLFRGEPVIGAIFLPVAPRAAFQNGSPDGDGSLQLGSAVLHARLGGGAYLDGEQVRASEAPKPEPSSLVGLPGHHSHQFMRSGALLYNPGELRSLGSVCYETGMVACGIFRYAIFRNPRLWDVAAGVSIIREAGGSALRWNGSTWEPLVRFDPMLPRKKPVEASLRHWHGSVLLGGSESTRFVAERIRPGMSLWGRVGARIVRAVNGLQRQ